MLGQVDLRTLYFQPGLIDGWTGVRVLDVCGLLHEAILRVCELGWLDRRDLADERLAGLIVDEITSASSTNIRLPMPKEARAHRLAIGFLEETSARIDYSEQLIRAGLSRRTAERIFNRETGVSPARWRRQAHLARTLEHLASGGLVSDAAYLAGYQSQSAFSDNFRRTFGFAPGAFKKA
jgi:AraC-like DNA-binding protein